MTAFPRPLQKRGSPSAMCPYTYVSVRWWNSTFFLPSLFFWLHFLPWLIGLVVNHWMRGGSSQVGCCHCHRGFTCQTCHCASVLSDQRIEFDLSPSLRADKTMADTSLGTFAENEWDQEKSTFHHCWFSLAKRNVFIQSDVKVRLLFTLVLVHSSYAQSF